MLNVLAGVAQFEREMMLERQRIGGLASIELPPNANYTLQWTRPPCTGDVVFRASNMPAVSSACLNTGSISLA